MATLSPWRLVRNPYTRAAYDFLARHGVKVSKMHLYGANLDDFEAEQTAFETVSFDVRASDELTPPPSQDASALTCEDDVVVAVADGDPVGFQTLSLDRAVYMSPVERELEFEAFLWGLYVTPNYRRRGIATELIRRSLALARERGADEAYTLVALDNGISKRALTTNGFEPSREVSYYKFRRFERRVERAL
ncbi:GNAT family N-acetyltransferase [Halorussus halophilus]|uniref:GNAT family N-acetyltransferase n=1 Tax=Halorussus halophilus TaxID=2650975 RepID=UPI00130181B0|nr:GNAT family N-acetyltransferase [Halorussus halophilus]